MTETLAEAPFATTDGPQHHASYVARAATAPVHRITLPTGQSVADHRLPRGASRSA